MAGKVIDDSASGVLILIVPFALAIVLLFTAWPLLLVLVLLGGVWNVWQRYQWLKWSRQLNPIFHQLIQANQGCLTALDLAMKANISGMAAKRFLDTKAQEFGTRAIEYEDKGTVYYFTTGSTLNSLLDSSETPKEIAIAPSTTSEQTSVESVVETPPEPEPVTAVEQTPVKDPVETVVETPPEPEPATAVEQTSVETPPEPEPVTAVEQTSVEEPVETVVETPPEPEPVTAVEQTSIEAAIETVSPEPEPVTAVEQTPVEEPVAVVVETVSPETEHVTAEADTAKEAQPEAPPESHYEDEQELAPAEKSPKKLMAFGSLIQIELANRLGVHSSTVYKRRYDSDFSEWSKSRDPQGIAWEYSEDTKEFYPVETK